MNPSIKSSALKYGLTTGIALSVLYILFYVIDATLLGSFWLGILILLAVLAVGIVSTAKAKSLNGGLLSFKEAFTAYFIPVALGLLIPTLLLYVLFNFIDPETAEMLKEQGLEQAEAMMERFGAPQAQIDEALAEAANDNPYAFGNTMTRFGGLMIFASIIGLIVSLIMKKTEK